MNAAFVSPVVPAKIAIEPMLTPIEEIEEALSIPIPSSDDLVLDDARRITGPGMLWGEVGAVIDIFFEGFDANHVVALWQKNARNVLDAVGWQDQHFTSRVFSGGVNLAISAPMDQLYSAIFAAQTAWHFCAAELLAQAHGDFDEMIADIKSVMVREENPKLIALIDAANAHNVDILCDDDEISIGHGTGSKTWPVEALPSPGELNWDDFYDVPVALITGTNGKTTTTRLCAATASAAGKIAGLTSTDFVQVGDRVLDRGDYSGPGGARMLLRDKQLEFAYLEVARGGILRRGLPLRRAKAALVTNVAADHLGDYGVNTVPDLAVAKFSVHRTLKSDGVLVLNADDDFVVAQAKETPSKICWYSLDHNTSQIMQAKENRDLCGWFDGKSLFFFDGQNQTSVVDVLDIPITMGGAARYNIQNALAALCLSRIMGIEDEAIRQGLKNFTSSPQDNPGRCNEFEVNGARVFIDFAHNPHSISALTQALSGIPAKRKFIMLSHAGDRSDEDIRDATKCALALKPDMVVAVELEDYLRGRELGEVSALIKEQCHSQGFSPDQILLEQSPSKGAALILSRLRPGDLALLLVLSERDAVFKMLGSA